VSSVHVKTQREGRQTVYFHLIPGGSVAAAAAAADAGENPFAIDLERDEVDTPPLSTKAALRASFGLESLGPWWTPSTVCV